MSKIASLCAVLTLLSVSTARADTVTVSGSGAFAAFPGYGYQYTASWDTSAGNFTFTTLSNNVLNAQGALISVNGLFQAVGPSFPDAVDLQATITLSFVNTTTGALALPTQLSVPAARYNGSVQDSLSTSLVSGEVRFSNPTESTTLTFTDLNGASVVNGSSQGVPATTADLQLQFTVNEHFAAGHVLQPSSDPNCASFDCMTPAHDLLGGNANFAYTLHTGGLVPEPGPAMLMAGGLFGLLAAGARRRRSVA